ncbi:MAG: carboxymuconolactone decarboxylase family protein, partial [Mycobacterium sp.]|nr:carboxymuconolactone decarboxylase family protein [Mycobacterium sp.]
MGDGAVPAIRPVAVGCCRARRLTVKVAVAAGAARGTGLATSVVISLTQPMRVLLTLRISVADATVVQIHHARAKEPPMSRIAPVSAPYSDALRQCFDRVVPAGMEPPRIYRVVARNESLFVDLVERGLLGLTGLFDRGVLAPRLREILILRTCAAAGNDYEWHLHVDSGLSP